MRLYRNVLILVIALALITGAYFIFSGIKAKNDKTNTTDSTPSNLQLMNQTSFEVLQMKIDNSSGSFLFKRKDENTDWTAVSPVGLKFDNTKINSMIVSFLPLNAVKEIGDVAGHDLSEYGLDKPLTIEMTLKDSTVRTFLIGNLVSTGDAYYIMEKGGAKVYTITSDNAKELFFTRVNIRSSTIYAAFKTDDVTGFSMDKGGQNFFSASKASSTEWKLNSPILVDADYDSINTILTVMSGITATAYVEENAADLSKYGLDKPSYAFVINLPTGNIKLVLGNLDKDSGMFYAMLAGSTDVFTIAASYFTFLDKPLDEIFSCFPYIVNITDVNKIIVNIDGKTITCGIQSTTDKPDDDKFTVDGKDATMKDANDNQPFRVFFQSLIGITLDEIDLNAVPSGQAEITFTYYIKKDPGVVKLEFIPKNENYYYVMRNGVYSGILVEKKQFDKTDGVRDSYKKLAAAIELVQNETQTPQTTAQTTAK